MTTTVTSITTDPYIPGTHQALTYRKLSIRLSNIERWLEFGTRPSSSLDEYHRDDSDLLSNPIDDLKALRARCQSVREELWKSAPPPSPDLDLIVRPSSIPDSGLGLYTQIYIPRGTICCYYSGDVHSYKSSTTLTDKSYLLRVGKPVTKPWWFHSSAQERSNPDNNEEEEEEEEEESKFTSKFSSLDEVGVGCIYVDPTNKDIKARYINDCIDKRGYNVGFEMDPCGERARIVSIRDIAPGEELFLEYGDKYWEGMDFVPRELVPPTTDR